MFLFSEGLGKCWENLYKNGDQLIEIEGVDTTKFVRQLSQLDDVINEIALIQPNGIGNFMENVGENDPAMEQILQKLFAIYQKIRQPTFLYIQKYKSFLTASLAYAELFLAKRSGIPHNEILNAMELRKKEEDNQNVKKWAFRQTHNSSGLFEKWLKSFYKTEMQGRKKRMLQYHYVCLIIVGLLSAIRLIIYVHENFWTRSTVEEVSETTPFILPANVGAAHMAAFSKLAEIIVGEGTSDAPQQNIAQCAICLGEIEPGTVIKRLPACKHTFHTECIQPWLKGYNNFCPMCRAKIFTEYKNGKVGPNTQPDQYAERDRRYATIGAQHFTLSSEVGEAHMAAFSELAEIIVGEGTSDAPQQNVAQTCVICLGEIEPGTVIKRLPACKHTFHTECIQTWLKGYNNFCPMCRAKIFTEYKNGKVGPNTQQNQYGTFDMI
uniref:RING-type domain-containing protein n=1 Tax=Globodera rostochiensis TaxID=31243 RepID=A0A914HK82_GLORO